MQTGVRDVEGGTVERMSSSSPPSAAADGDTIELVVPLQTRYNSTVRVVTAAAAAELGFTVDDIDDLRLGVEEALSSFDEHAATAAQPATVRIEFHLGHDALRVVLTALRGDQPQRPADLDVLGRRVLGAVVDAFELHADCIELVKRRRVD